VIAAAAKGVLRDLHPLGDSPCRSLADRSACVPEELPTVELEGFLTGLIVAMPIEPVGGEAVGDDVEETQELDIRWWRFFDGRWLVVVGFYSEMTRRRFLIEGRRETFITKLGKGRKR